MNEVRAVVIGAAGAMGQAHTRVYSTLSGVKLVGISDLNEEVGQALARKYQTTFFAEYQRMLEALRPDVCSVVVPTKLHYEVGCAALRYSQVVLVEKPITLDLEAGQNLIDMAERLGKILTIGHIERYNPAVRVTKQLLDYGEVGTPLKILFRREGPDPERVRDVNILVDIGIHDFDLARFFIGRAPTRINAEGGAWRRGKLDDDTNVMLAFKRLVRPPVVAIVLLSWINKAKIRKIDITGSDGYISVDLTQRRVVIQTEPTDLSQFHGDFGDYKKLTSDIGFRKEVPVPDVEPLAEELSAVVSAARGEKAELVDPAEALDALRIALEATQQIHDKNEEEG